MSPKKALNPKKLAAIVAKRHGLTPDEAIELRGRNLAELASHARHLVGRREAVEAAKRRNPHMPDYAIANIEGAYDGGGVRIDDDAGKEEVLEALRDRLRGRDPLTNRLLERVGRNTLTGNSDRSARIRARLTAAGYSQEDDQ